MNVLTSIYGRHSFSEFLRFFLAFFLPCDIGKVCEFSQFTKPNHVQGGCRRGVADGRPGRVRGQVQGRHLQVS